MIDNVNLDELKAAAQRYSGRHQKIDKVVWPNGARASHPVCSERL